MQRFLFIDLARGFTVLFIPGIHAIMLYGEPSVQYSLLGAVLRLIAEWPGAQLLMFLMGVSFSLSRRSTISQLKRAIAIFVAGYVLNVFKFLFPLWTGLMPGGFLLGLDFVHEGSRTAYLALVGDIFQLAGISLGVLALIKRLTLYVLYAVFLLFVVVMVSPLLWDLHHSNIMLDHVLHLLGGHPDDCFFPLFPWLVFPLAGLAIGKYFQMPFCSMKAVLVSGGFLFTTGIAMMLSPWHFPGTSFYRTWPDATIMHLGFVMVWVCLWYWLGKIFEKDVGSRFGYVFGKLAPASQDSRFYYERRVDSSNEHDHPLVQLLCFCSRHITVIYVLQWVVVFWLMPVIGFHKLDLLTAVFYGVNITICVFAISYFVGKWIKKASAKRRC